MYVVRLDPGSSNMPPPSEAAASTGSRAGCASCAATAPAAAGVAGQEADDDAEEADDAVDNGHDNAADTVDDSHDGAPDGAQGTLKLERRQCVSRGVYILGCGGRWSGLTQETTAPIVNVVYLVMFGWWCGVLLCC